MADGVEARVRDAIEPRRAAVNEALEESLAVRPPERLYEAARHLFVAGGKRLRPAIVLLAAEAVADVDPGEQSYEAFPDADGEPIDVMTGALAVEVVHLFTLIHDDIMDDDDLRRGVPAVHREYDLETAILAGDTLFSTAFEILLESGAPAPRTVRAVRRLSRACTEVCEGQAFDVGFERRSDVGVEEYHEMIRQKTAVLFGAAASIPAVLLGADRAAVDALEEYGLKVGQAFQIQDDVLDLTVPSDELGKRRGSDLVEGKRTLITVHARGQGVDVEGLLPDGEVTDEEIDDAVATLEDAGSIEYARRTAHELADEGVAALQALPENASRDVLEDVGIYLVERGY
ncbi:MAG: polyprenyl synthetase family protein [Halobacteriales archaeon]|nr:polyprenyl synthetase family protein [Halobacteriales archaeon]